MPIVVLTCIGALAVVAVAAFIVQRERALRVTLAKRVESIERERDAIDRRRVIEATFERELELAECEADVLTLTHQTMHALDPKRPFELHLVDDDQPVLRLVLATGVVNTYAAEVTSPWISIAARDGTTLVYPTTNVDDLCPHLRSRLVEPCSAVAIPLLVTGRTLGVLYAMGPIHLAPSPALVSSYEVIARAIASNIATARSFARDRRDDDEDRYQTANDRLHAASTARTPRS